jgi:hypothetical protein
MTNHATIAAPMLRSATASTTSGDHRLTAITMSAARSTMSGVTHSPPSVVSSAARIAQGSA